MKQAVYRTDIGHREPEFSGILSDCVRMIRPIVGIAADDTTYKIAFVTGFRYGRQRNGTVERGNAWSDAGHQ
ncbi:MAG: hypothetical protein WDN27_06650 [Candidatus Saccharibacteria bacterium]